MSVSSIAALGADDVLAIRDIVSAWNVAEDEGDAGRWADLFVEDGMSVYGNGRVESGRETLLRAAEGRAVDERMFGWSHWLLGEPTVDATEEGALVRHYYATVIDRGDDGFGFWSLSERVYRVRRDGDRWRIVRRTIHPIPLGLAPDAEDRRRPTDVVEHRSDDGLSAADRIEIQDLLTRYGVAEDTGDGPGTAALFTEDGATVNPRGQVTSGRAAIEAAASKRWDTEANRRKVHFAVNVRIDAFAGGASVRSYNVILSSDGASEPVIESIVEKVDRVGRTEDGWRFVERRVVPLGRTPVAGTARRGEPASDRGVTSRDRFAIADLITRYNVAEDTGDADDVARLFAEDGALIDKRGGATTGPDAIAGTIRSRWQQPEAATKVHWSTNITVVPTPDGAEAHSYSLVLTIDADGRGRISGSVAKRDVLRRVDGRWLFVERRNESIGRK